MATIYLSEAPSPPMFCVGRSSNFVSSESDQIQNVKLLQNMVSNTTREGGGGVLVNQREGERGNRGEFRSQKLVVENAYMTECTPEIGYLQSINSVC